MNWVADIIIGVLALIGTLGGAYIANRKSTALIAYRIEQLERKVDLHNQVIERTYKLERRVDVIDERDKEQDRRIEALESE